MSATDLVLEMGDDARNVTLPEGWTADVLAAQADEAFGLSNGEFSDDPVASLNTPGQAVTYTAGGQTVTITATGELGVWEMIAGAHPRLAPLIDEADFEQYRTLSDDDTSEINEQLAKVLDPIIEEVAEQGIPFPQVPIGSALQTVPQKAGLTGAGEAEQAASSLVKLLLSAEMVKLRRETLKPTNLGEACLDRDIDYLIAIERPFPFVFNLNEQLEAVISTLFAFVGSGKAASVLGVESTDMNNAYSQVVHEVTGGHLTPTSTLNRDLRHLFGLEKENALTGVIQPTATGKKLLGYLLAQM